jgi:hypothetical protein
VRSATVRRCALVAVLVLLVPAWGRSGRATGGVQAAESVVVRSAKAGTLGAGDAAAPTAAIRRQAAGVLGLTGARSDQRRAVAAMALLGLVALIRLRGWDRLPAVRNAPSSLARRRYAIALRAPPVPSCN